MTARLVSLLLPLPQTMPLALPIVCVLLQGGLMLGLMLTM